MPWGSSSTTATGRRRRSFSPPTFRECPSGRARWGSPSRATISASSGRRARSYHRGRLAISPSVVRLRPGHTPGDELVRTLQDHVKRVTAPYKYPRAIEFVAGLPKTVSGKIRRVELREQERRGQRTP